MKTHLYIQTLRICVLLLTVWGGTGNASAAAKAKPNYEKRIAGIEITIQARKHKIEFLKFKQNLHKECLCSCRGSHSSSASGFFDGKPYKVCHHHPHGDRHNSGVTQAISALQLKIEAMERSVELQEQKKAELQSKADSAE